MNRLKQSLGAALPTFGSTKDEERPTPPPISIDRVNLVESHQQIITQIYASFTPFYRGVAKTRSNPLQEGLELRKGEQKQSSTWFGETMTNCAEEIDRLEGYGEVKDKYRSTLALVGEAHLELGNLTRVYAELLQEGLMDTLEKKLEDFKEFEKLSSRADKKRGQLEAVMIKLEKGNSKKDTRSELEHELDQAEWTYSDACEQLTRKADELEEGTGNVVEALKGVIDAQLDFATNYTSMLQSIRTQLPSPIASVSHSTSPTRSRSSTLQPPPSLAATRMNRSLSESSAQNVPTAFSNSILSSLGPGRSRSSTVSKLQNEEIKEKEKEVKNRSRSGSMLERFALGKKKKDKSTAAGETNGDEHENGDGENLEKEEGNRSRSNSGTASPSGGRGWATPSLPTLGSFSKKPSTSSYGYGSLRDSDDQQQHASSPSSSPALTPLDFSSSSTTTTTASPSKASSSRRFVPPSLKRTQTAPASTTSSTPSPSSTSGRFTQPSSPLKSTFSTTTHRTRIVRARWAYSPNVRDTDELEFEKGDLVIVEKEVNKDWWIGRNENSGEKGMFPSAYVVVQEQEQDEDRYGRSDDDDDDDEGIRRSIDQDSLRSSTTTTTSTRSFSTDDNDSEDDDFKSRLQPSSKPFSSSSHNSSSPRPTPPPPPHPPARNGSTTPRKQPPPPPARRTNSAGNLLNQSRRGEDEGSPFD